ncbi:MAG: tetratricopeptide repeat protein, partial [Elainella sp.]
QLFTDRVEFVCRFGRALNEEPAGQQILWFYGDGGNGKSLLLKFLRQHCCKRLSDERWQAVRQRPEVELANLIRQLNPSETTPVPAVLHDFGQSIGIERPQDPFYGLLMLRRNLAEATNRLGYRLRQPLYDFACIWYLHQKGKSPQEIKSLFPLSDMAGALSTLVDVVSKNSVGATVKAVLDFFLEDLEERVTVYLSQVGVSEDRIREIQQMDVDTELIYELPGLLAADLNAAMRQKQATKRLVLMFDTHEAFWGQQKNLADTLFFERDEWLRRLLRELNLRDGLVVVVAGREPSRWPEAGRVKPRTEIPAQYLVVQQVGHFANSDAALYLQQVGIRERELQQALIATASVRPNEVHPLYLGLSADTVLQAQQQGITLTAADFPTLPDLENQTQLLIERLLRYVDREIRYAVHALSACRWFDFDLYCLLGDSLKFQPTKPGFDLLTSFSFVWQNAESDPPTYRIHDLLRRLDDETAEPTTTEAHRVLLQHYQQQNQPAEEIYHLNRLDWEAGAEKWNKVFEEALEYSRYEQCRVLLEVRNALFIRSDFWLGRISDSEGQYFADLSKHQEALQEYQEAIAAYDVALQRDPDYLAVLNNKGIALQNLGDLQSGLSQHDAAVQSYVASVVAYNAVLQCAPDYIVTLSNKGNTLVKLGNLQFSLSQHETAMQSYAASVAAYDAALQRAPDDIAALNNKGNVLRSLGDLQSGLSQHEAAMQSYTASVAACDAALQRAPDSIYALNNKGLALRRLGDFQSDLSQHEAAMQSYAASVAAYDAALQRAPDYIAALNNRGLVLQSLGDLQSDLSQYEAAVQSYAASVAVYDAVLQRAPDYIAALNNKGNTLAHLGDLQSGLSQPEAAMQSYAASVAAYDAALQRAPDDIYALNNKAITLRSLGDLQSGLSQHEAAKAAWELALELVDRVLELAPNRKEAIILRDQLQQRLQE